MAVCQALNKSLPHRYREQAPSHIGLCVQSTRVQAMTTASSRPPTAG